MHIYMHINIICNHRGKRITPHTTRVYLNGISIVKMTGGHTRISFRVYGRNVYLPPSRVCARARAQG